MNPGSPYASVMGCTCDPAPNNYGVGNSTGWDVTFAVKLTCPLHGSAKWQASGITADGGGRISGLVYGKM